MKKIKADLLSKQYMKNLILILIISLFATADTVAQVIPLGVYVDIDGKIKFWNTEANRNGHLNDTVLVTYNGGAATVDLRNLKYDYLTLREAPRTIWTLPSNQDPSKLYDTTDPTISADMDYLHLGKPTPELFSLAASTTLQPETLSYSAREYFWDDIRGCGLNDSVLRSVKNTLAEYVDHYRDKYLTADDRNNLQAKLSLPDSIVDIIAFYDYLVDLYVKYDFDTKNRLSKVIGYHWDYGLEVVNIKYDKLDHLIYFSHQSIGSIRQEFFFEYDKSGRVSTVKNQYSTVGTNAESGNYTHPEITRMKFTYNKSGKMNSQSFLQKDGKWETWYFEIK